MEEELKAALEKIIESYDAKDIDVPEWWTHLSMSIEEARLLVNESSK